MFLDSGLVVVDPLIPASLCTEIHALEQDRAQLHDVQTVPFQICSQTQTVHIDLTVVAIDMCLVI